MALTPRLQLPLLTAGQAQKEITHNEALLSLDAMVQSVCIGGPANIPPTSPAEGSIYLCGAAPVGAWAGQPNSIALSTAGGWRFVKAFEGLRLVDSGTGLSWTWGGGQWVNGRVEALELRIGGFQVVGAQRGSIAMSAGGSVVDAESRAAIGQILSALRSHGLIAS